MKFLIDAQLPRRLAVQLQQAGFDATHTLDLPLGNRTPDSIINELDGEQVDIQQVYDSFNLINGLYYRTLLPGDVK